MPESADRTEPDVPAGVRSADPLYTPLKFALALALFAMAAITFVDVIGRYVFNAPIPGTFEIVGLMLGVVMFTALPLVSRERSHITVDLFDAFIRGRMRRLRQFLVLAGSAAVVGFLAERLIATAIDEYRSDYVTEYFGVTRAPLLIVMALLCVVTCLILVAMMWMDLTGRLEPLTPGGELAERDPTEDSLL